MNSTLPAEKPSAQKTTTPNPPKRTSPRQATPKNPSPLAKSTPKVVVKQEIMADEPVVKSVSIFGIDDMKVLTKNFAKNPYPSAKKMNKIAKKLDKTPSQIKGWFVRRRSGSIKSLPSVPIVTRVKREREESPVKTEIPDEDCEQRAKRACRRSPIVLQDDSSSEDDIDAPLEIDEEEESPVEESVVHTVENISPDDVGFYLDREASNELFFQIWKTENKLPHKALEYLSMRSGRTVGAVRTWFYEKTKKEKANSITKPTEASRTNEKIIKQAETLRSVTSEFATVKNISPADDGFYLNHAAAKKLFFEIWKTEPELPHEALRYLAMRSEKSVPAVRLHFQRLTKQHKWEQYKKNNVRIYMPADKCYKVIQIGGEEFAESSDREDEFPQCKPVESDKENEKETTPSSAAMTTLPEPQENDLPEEKTTESEIEEVDPSDVQELKKVDANTPFSIDNLLDSAKAKKDDSAEKLRPTTVEAAQSECDAENDNLPLENSNLKDASSSDDQPTDSEKPGIVIEKPLPRADSSTAAEESDDEYEVITTQLGPPLPICHKYASSVLKDGKVIIPHDSPILIELYERSSIEDLL